MSVEPQLDLSRVLDLASSQICFTIQERQLWTVEYFGVI